MEQYISKIVLIIIMAGHLFPSGIFPSLKGPYLGQKPPGIIPVIFAPGIISTSANENNCAFSPDGEELFFCRYAGKKNTIYSTRISGGIWTKPQKINWSGSYNDVDPSFSRDGNRLYFSSTRPAPNTPKSSDANLWYLDRLQSGKWSEPKYFGIPNQPGKDDYYSSFTTSKTLYFSLFEGQGNGGNLYKSVFSKGAYQKPILLDKPLSTKYNEHDPFVAADESFLFFTSDRIGGYGKGDLYISFRTESGAWRKPHNLGRGYNTPAYEYCLTISPDRKYIFFTRNTEGNGDIYWVDAKVLKRFQSLACRE